MGEREFRTLEEYCTHYGGLEEKECGSGGNCFYHCLAAAENMDYWIYVQNIEQNGPDNLRQAMQMQVSPTHAWSGQPCNYCIVYSRVTTGHQTSAACCFVSTRYATSHICMKHRRPSNPVSLAGTQCVLQ